ncbi:MAG: hypothetical protein R3C58_08695 [Parvularculaceae bacterium]
MRNPFNADLLKPFAAAGAAAALVFAAPAASAHDFGDLNISLNDLDFDDEDLLPKLVEMDREDIADLRADMAEARKDIKEAIADVEKARKEAAATPETRTIVAAALAAAAVSVEEATGEVFEKVRAELARAETELNDTKANYSAEEYAETKDVIAAIREELSGLEVALGELITALNA